MPFDDEQFRRERRVEFTTQAPLAPDPGSGGIIEDVSTIDLSSSGLRLRFCGRLVPGQIVEVFLGKRPEPCRVVWTSPDRESNGIIAGLEFVCPWPGPRRRDDSSSNDSLT